VRYVAGVQPGECCPELRAPLVSEGVEVAPFLHPSDQPPAARGSHPQEPVDNGGEEPDDLKPTLAGADLGHVLWLTLELNDQELLESLAASHGEKRTLALHLSPARELGAEILSRLNLVVSGEAAGAVLARCTQERQGQRGLLRRIGAYGPGRAVILGQRSATHFDGERFLEVQGPAGNGLSDTVRELVFSATLSAALAEGPWIEHALALALKSAALSPAGSGAFPELPSAEALWEVFSEREGPPGEARGDAAT
jgi:sugar/nucleoside kinase (ribokinase family)